MVEDTLVVPYVGQAVLKMKEPESYQVIKSVKAGLKLTFRTTAASVIITIYSHGDKAILRNVCFLTPLLARVDFSIFIRCKSLKNANYIQLHKITYQLRR
jgi:hypothetical protein